MGRGPGSIFAASVPPARSRGVLRTSWVPLLAPGPPHSSPAACRHAHPFLGHLWRRHLAGTCLWATFHGTHGSRDNRTSSSQRNMSHPTNPMLTQPGRRDGCPRRRLVRGRYVRLLLTACLCL